MQTTFLFCLLATITCVQCRPSSEADATTVEASDAEIEQEKDFCTDIKKADQLLFLGCIAELVPEAVKVMTDNGDDFETLLDKICGKKDLLYQAKLIKALEMSDEAIDKCSELLQSPTL
uniref:Putative secreted protein n=1 Tax=Amblyomma americanum TaxID=6943 RepID=A0A0C9R4L2_AMBAM